jgi:3-methyladenine DNA glycosylase AlkD
MSQPLDPDNGKELAGKIDAEIGALPDPNVPNMRGVRCKYSRMLEEASPELILAVARELLKTHGNRWLACELIRNNTAAFQRIGEAEVEEFGQGIDSWGAVDAIAGILAGPAWMNGQVSDELIHRWAQSKDRWWRRAALVSTVPLNVRAHGGTGDVPRTLTVCRLLVSDRDDMVEKAMSWALRALVVHDPKAVRELLGEYEDVLAARVTREGRNKLTIGLKNPTRKKQ